VALCRRASGHEDRRLGPSEKTRTNIFKQVSAPHPAPPPTAPPQTLPKKTKDKKSSKNKKSKKTTKGISKNFVKYEQGQSETELAIVREEMRNLKSELQEEGHLLTDNIEETSRSVDPSKMTRFEELTKKHAAIFAKVNRTRELAQNVELHNTFGEIVLEQATKANNFAKLSTKTFMEKISEHYGIPSGSTDSGEKLEIDWVAMGKATSVLFNGPPRISFLHGSVMKNVVEKKRVVNKKRKRVGRDTTSAASTAGVLDNLNESDDKDDSVNLMKGVAATCQKINQRKKAKTDYLELVVDPTSFPKTIENMFAASFLIKEDKLRIELSDKNIPMVYNVAALGGTSEVAVYQGNSQVVPREDVDEPIKENTHCVVALNFHDWQKLCHAIEPKNGQWEPQIERPDVVISDDEEEEEDEEEEDEEDEEDEDEDEDEEESNTEEDDDSEIDL